MNSSGGASHSITPGGASQTNQSSPVYLGPSSPPQPIQSNQVYVNGVASVSFVGQFDSDVIESSWALACTTGGHEVSDIIEYIDGAVVAYCDQCEQRIKLARIPGAIYLPQLRLLIGSYADRDETVPDDVVLMVADVLKAVRAERKALNEAEELIAVLSGLIDLREEHVGKS